MTGDCEQIYHYAFELADRGILCTPATRSRYTYASVAGEQPFLRYRVDDYSNLHVSLLALQLVHYTRSRGSRVYDATIPSRMFHTGIPTVYEYCSV